MPEQIERLAPAVRQYLRAFNLVAIYVRPDGYIDVGHEPGRATAAWWAAATPRYMRKIADRARKDARLAAEAIAAIAAELGIPLTEHATVMARATAATARISRTIAQANATGGLQFFNAEYKRRRAAAAAAGKPFMSYGQARARLQQAIAEGAAAGGAVTPELLASVLRVISEFETG